MNIPLSAARPDFVLPNSTNGSMFLIRRDYLSKLDWPGLTHVVFPVIMPIILVFGVVGNSLTIAVLWHKGMKVSTNVILFRGLIVTDLFVLLIWSINGISEYYLFQVPEGVSFYLDVVYPTIYIGCLYLIYLSRGINIWITIALCVERFMIMCVEDIAWCTQKRAKLLIASISVLFGLFSIQQLLEFTPKSYPCFEKLCYINHFTEIGVSLYYSKGLFWFNMCMYNIIPTTVLVLLSIPIIYKLCMVNRRRSKGISKSGPMLKKRERNATVVLLLVVFFSVLCNLNGPYFVAVYVYDSYRSYHAYLVCIFNVIVVLNSSINFVIYGIVGERFRKILLKILRHLYYTLLRKTPPISQLTSETGESKSRDMNSREDHVEMNTRDTSL